MQLDIHQKTEFVSYWGGCPLIYDGKLCHVDVVDKLEKDKFRATFYKYHIIDGEKDPGNPSLPKVKTEIDKTFDLEKFEPYFLESGFYQLAPHTAFWITRRAERSRKKGMHHENTDAMWLGHIKQKVKDVVVRRSDCFMKDYARIFYNKLPNRIKEEGSLDLAIAKMNNELANPDEYGRSGYSLALSRNIALVSTDHEIPIVFYKMIPVGYYLNGKVLLQKKKAVSADTIKEETALNVELYEG